MNHPLLSRFRAATAVAAASAFLIACGGGDGSAPPPAPGTVVPTGAPVVTITKSVSDAAATGPVTFTFTFNRDVGTSFTADDVAVTNGTKGAFTRLSGTSATLVVTPPANSSGSMTVGVAANVVQDSVGNSNAAASVQQAYETVVRIQMALPVSFDVADVGYGLAGFGGAEASTIVTDPTLATNKVARVVRAAGAETFAGTTVTDTRNNVQLGFSPKIPFTANDSRMSVRVWSPNAGIPVRLKVEDSTDPNKSVETEATVTVAAGWETLTFNFANQAAGTAALNLAFNYNKATIFFDFGRSKATAV
ncbi:MAG: Ig-like domain-containing protein, partial [Rubrivivax sp.]|nr:Ig-like domain-containing protein [Rubrivivax sp.]